MSDQPDAMFNHGQDESSIERCITNVKDCSHFVLILDSRYGSEPYGDGRSACWIEFDAAVDALALDNNRAVHILVRDVVWSEYSEIKRGTKERNQIRAVDNTRQFDFIDTIRNHEHGDRWVETFTHTTDLKLRLSKVLGYAVQYAAAANAMVRSVAVPYFAIHSPKFAPNTHPQRGIWPQLELSMRNVGSAPALQMRMSLGSDLAERNFTLYEVENRFVPTELVVQQINESRLNQVIGEGELTIRLAYTTLGGFSLVDEFILKCSGRTWKDCNILPKQRYRRFIPRKWGDEESLELLYEV